jgi:integrase
MRMGRKRSGDFDLPPRMRRKGSAFYYDTQQKPRKWIPLGSDFAVARRKWANLEGATAGDCITFKDCADRYERDVIPTKGIRTQAQNKGELANLRKVFDEMPMEQIRPSHIALYLDAREAKIRANREVSLFSHIFNWSRSRGLTDAANPAYGVDRNEEKGRDIYVEDDAYQAVYAKAPQELKDAMDLAYCTGQRVSDVLRWKRTDIRDGALQLEQGKTGKKLRIAIAGPLAKVVKRLTAHREGVTSLYLVQLDGQPVTYQMLNTRFNAACEAAEQDFQFRDLRAKAGTDRREEHDIGEAQRLLGHESVTMTETYTRQRRGDLVAPNCRRIVEVAKKKGRKTGPSH